MADDFDPNAYLKTAPSPQQFDPDAYLKTPVTQIGAAMEGVKSGASLGFGDEITGAYHASGVPKMLAKLDPKARVSAIGALVSAIGGAGKMAYEKLTGDEGTKGEVTTKYEAARDESRAVQKAAKEQFPKTFIGGQVAGSLLLPAGGVAAATTLPVRIGRGAAIGAGIGGVSGFGEGEGIADSATKAAIGAGTGGIVGGIAPPLVEGALRGGRALLNPAITALQGAINPETEAARRIVGAIDRDVRNSPTGTPGLTPQEFTASTQGGGPATIMDLGGETTRALARSAANTSAEGRDVLNRTINDRFEGQSGRVTGWLNDTFNFPNAQAQQTALDTARRAANTPAYARAERESARLNPNGLWDDGFEQISQAPVVQDAIRKASVTGGNRAAREGFTPVGNPFVLDRESGRMVLRADDQGNRAVPNLRFWDEVKKNLDRTGTGDARDFARVLRNHVDDFVPSYQEARQGAAHFFGAEDALEAGQNFVTAKLGNREARAALADMSANERQLFQDGFVSRFVETLGETGDRRNVLNQIAQSPASRERLYMVLGRNRATELEARLRVEGVMDLARTAVQGNSTTARQLAELGLAGGAGTIGAYGTYNMDPVQMGTAAVMGALLAGRRHIDQRVAQHVAQMLTSDDPAVLARGIRAVARNDNLIDALRTADRKLALVGGQQGANVPALQAAGIGRADQNDPNVPRPSAQ